MNVSRDPDLPMIQMGDGLASQVLGVKAARWHAFGL